MTAHEYETLSPPDAVVAVRSLPRRFSEGLAPLDPDDALTLLRPGPDGVSAAGHASRAAAALAAAASDLEALARHDDATLSTTPAPDEPASVEAALSQLTAGADRLASAADRSDAEFWSKTGTRDGAGVRADQILRHAVSVAVDHLNRAQQARQATRAR